MPATELLVTDRDGPIDCGGCGACCLHVSAPPFNAGEYAHLPAWARTEVASARDAAEGNGGPCVWFDLEAKTCRQHTIRPLACRDFAVGGEACQLLRTHYAIA
jgi:Fe-S-cluster containining protein